MKQHRMDLHYLYKKPIRCTLDRLEVEREFIQAIEWYNAHTADGEPFPDDEFEPIGPHRRINGIDLETSPDSCSEYNAERNGWAFTCWMTVYSDRGVTNDN